MKKTSLAPTAATVLFMGEPVFQQDITRKYISMVDLSSGMAIYEKVNRPLEVLNRKFFIRETLLKFLGASQTAYQWVILAAGVDPMALEILSLRPDKIAHVFEIDTDFMTDKRRLYKLAAPHLLNQISLVTGDIASPELPKMLQNNYGFMPRVPTIVQMEGITYYLPAQKICDILASFSSHHGRNRILMDYLLPTSDMSSLGQAASKLIFGTISEQTGFSSISHYSSSDITQMLEDVGGSIIDHQTNFELEGTRTGTHTVIQSPQDNIIELIWGAI